MTSVRLSRLNHGLFKRFHPISPPSRSNTCRSRLTPKDSLDSRKRLQNAVGRSGSWEERYEGKREMLMVSTVAEICSVRKESGEIFALISSATGCNTTGSMAASQISD
jgi:hypothetical protein